MLRGGGFIFRVVCPNIAENIGNLGPYRKLYRKYLTEEGGPPVHFLLATEKRVMMRKEGCSGVRCATVRAREDHNPGGRGGLGLLFTSELEGAKKLLSLCREIVGRADGGRQGRRPRIQGSQKSSPFWEASKKKGLFGPQVLRG